MKLKETDELIDIWQKHNSIEWTDIAFEVVAEILRERLGEIPSQDELGEDNDGEDILDGKVASSSNTRTLTSKMEIVSPMFWLEKQNVIALEDKVIIEFTSPIREFRVEYEYREPKSRVIRGKSGDAQWTEIGNYLFGAAFMTAVISVFIMHDFINVPYYRLIGSYARSEKPKP